MHFLIAASLALVTSFSGNPEKPKKEKWVKLFDGKTTNGWHTYGKATAGEAWKVVDGNLYLDAKAKKESKIQGGDIVSATSYENFHLKLEWKIAANGNSGIIFWVQDDPKKYKQVWHTGPEVQVLDNEGHADGKIKKHRTANLYDLVEGTEGAAKPVGSWNKCEIIAKDGQLNIFLNGINTVSVAYGDDNWRNLIAGSKFKTQPDFGKFFKGHIALQDHGDEVWYRKIKIKKL